MRAAGEYVEEQPPIRRPGVRSGVPPGSVVTWCTADPSLTMTNPIGDESGAVLWVKAIECPSGDQAGPAEVPSVVRRRSADPSREAMYRSEEKRVDPGRSVCKA